ncbi:death-associated protein kinase 1-like [Mustela erminea]|uniref:death-associated protein kinase 1-like n=1 Tax=Mustela erminea TaxID=36723 RepID=UPI0013872665|nr:death-associated protein kinase 1-like [Mustela erminea]
MEQTASRVGKTLTVFLQQDGKTAEELAKSEQHEHIAGLLARLRKDAHRGLFIQQLRPTQNLQSRIKLKLFGHSGSGKTTLVESLKCGLLRSFFRRRRPRLSSASSTRFPPFPLASKPAGEKHPQARSAGWPVDA